MQQGHDLGCQGREVLVRRNARAKRFSLRVSRADGRVSLSVLTWAPEAEALAFLRAREEWVRSHLDRAPGVQRARIGAQVPICGVPRDVVTYNAVLDAVSSQVELGRKLFKEGKIDPGFGSCR